MDLSEGGEDGGDGEGRFGVLEEEVSGVSLPGDLPVVSDFSEARREVYFRESDLLDIEVDLGRVEEELVEVLEKKDLAEEQLLLLDQALGSVSLRAGELLSREQKLLLDLEAVTREKAELLSLIRVEREAYEKFLRGNFLREESFQFDGEVSMLRWLFSDESVSGILDDRKRGREFEVQKSEQLERLGRFKRELDEKEREAAALFGQIASLRGEVTRNEKFIEDSANQKAQALAHLEFREGKAERELANLRRQQGAATLVVQHFRGRMGELGEEGSSPKDLNQRGQQKYFFEFPLKVSKKVMSSFHDEEYEREFGIVHNGVDFFAPQGSGIFAPADGVVEKVGSNGYGYSYFILRHDGGFHTVYGHVSEILVNEGQEVSVGDLVGKTGGERGSRGAGYFTAGSHLHFEILRGGKFLDPVLFIR